MSDLRECLAALAHDQWAGWMEYLFSKCIEFPDSRDGVIIPRKFVERWQRQMVTPYEQLPENEKESDRKEADRVLEIVG